MKQTLTESQLINLVEQCTRETLNEWGGWGFMKTAKGTQRRQDRWNQKLANAEANGNEKKAARMQDKLGREATRINASREAMGVKAFPYNPGDKADFANDKQKVMQFQTWVNQNSQNGQQVLVVDGIWGPKTQGAFDAWINTMKEQLGEPTVADMSNAPEQAIRTGQQRRIQRKASKIKE